MHAEQFSGICDTILDIDVGRIVPTAPRPDAPFRIAVLGDFRGLGARGTAGTELAHRSPIAVDRDNFDSVLAHFAPALRLSLDDAAPEIAVEFRAIDDFHPDRLYERLPLFRSLRELRQRLAHPATFAAAARELWGAAVPGEVSPSPPPATTGPAPAAASSSPQAGNLLDQILGEAAGSSAAPPPRRDDFADFIRRIVAPHAVANADPRQADALAQVDAVITSQMRALLHHPDFQALEALWRGVFFLVRRVETDAQLGLCLMDVSRSEVEADLTPEGEIGDTGLYRLLVESSAGLAGGVPWAALIGAYTFGSEPSDARLLRRLGRLAQLAGGPWIAAADARLVGSSSFGTDPDPDDWTPAAAAEWAELRQAPEAAGIGLALPRFLLRLPYGQHAEPCEAFEFEEVAESPNHESFLWGNPALICALLLARAFTADGWSLRLGAHREVEGLPLHLIREAGVVRAQPCAEARMTERAAARILDAGVMPLASLSERDVALLVRFQSIAQPATALAGRWARTGGQ